VPFPLPPPPNFRVSVSESNHVRLNWSDYSVAVKQYRQILGYRLYRSTVQGEIGVRIADEKVLGPGVFQYDDSSADAGPTRFYLLVAVEDAGYGAGAFDVGPNGQPDPGAYDLMPYDSRPWGSPMRGWGEAPFGFQSYGF
jgi:hypothetical protein